MSTVSTPADVRTDAPPRSSTLSTSAGRPASAHVVHTSTSPRAWRRFEQPRVLETNVRQLPQQVIQPHNRSVMPCRAGNDAIDPQDVIGRPGRRSFAGADPHRRQPPRRCPQQQRRCRLRGASPITTRTSPRVAMARNAPTGSAASIETAGRARLPTITGWTNSTATCRACSVHSGATHHIVAPAAKRRARSRAHAARSSARPCSIDTTPAGTANPVAAPRASTFVPPTRCSGPQWDPTHAAAIAVAVQVPWLDVGGVPVHELSMCEAIARTVVDRAAGRRVLTVTVRIGYLRQVVPDALAFSLGDAHGRAPSWKGLPCRSSTCRPSSPARRAAPVRRSMRQYSPAQPVGVVP